MKQFIFPTFICLLLSFIHVTIILAQSPAPAPASPSPPAPLPPSPPAVLPPTASPPAPAPPLPTIIGPAPGPSGPTNITHILQKVGHFNTLIRLLKSTQTADRINTQLSTTSQGLTIFAPSDSAFGNLNLNSYTDQQKSELVQFHILPTFLSVPQFQTLSNPVSTEAGGTNYGEFPLNVTSSGNGVNITTGFANASVISIVYTDNQLAVYEVDRVLLPQRFFIDPPPPPPIPAPTPAPAKPKKRAPVYVATVSHAVRLSLMHEMFHASFLVAVLAASWLF